MKESLDKPVPLWMVVLASAATIVVVAAVVLKLRTEAAQPPPASAAREPMRVPLWIEPGRVVHHPRFRFSFDPPGALSPFREAERIDQVVAGAGSDLERFRLLTRWARSQFEPGVPSPYPPIDATIILRDIRSGYTGGFCAQYNYVLAQALMSLGYPARYVTLRGHEVIEAWLRDEGRWICLDPLYSATYVDEDGSPLSVLDLARRRRQGAPLLPGPGSLEEAREKLPDALAEFSVWLHNDHITSPINFTDIARYKVRFLFPDDPLPVSGLATSEIEDLYFDPDAE